jgi:DNA-binding MarR family transcriptional regulator
MAAMDADRFARQFDQLYRELYRRAVRRVENGRALMSTETTALLLHLAQAGPMSLSELTRHFDRALSTLSAKVADLEQQGFLARQRDTHDARRALIWLSPVGREALLNALEVLDTRILADAAARISPEQRDQLLDGLRMLTGALPKSHPHHGDP